MDAISETTAVNVEQFEDREEYLPSADLSYETKYSCQCESCVRSRDLETWLPKFFLGGIIFPLFWIANVAIYLNLQLFKPHKTTHPAIPNECLPTAYEMKMWEDRNPFTKQRTRSKSDCSSSDDELAVFRMHRLRKVASQIIESHDSLRKHFSKWTGRSIIGIAAYIVTIVIIVVGCKTSTSQK